MNPKLKFVITIIVIVALLALFFWATRSISSLAGHSITGSAVGAGAIVGDEAGNVDDAGNSNLDEADGAQNSG